MKKAKITVIVERGSGKRNFSAFAVENIGNMSVGGYGGTAREAMDDCWTTVNEFREIAAERGEDFPDEVELDFKFDIGAFFDYYPIDVTQAARYIGINASVLRQYVTALREPREAQIKKIKEGINRLAADLAMGKMIDKPAVDYV